MTYKRSQTIRLASAAILSTFMLTACVQTLDLYDDEYYPAEQTVVVKHQRPVYHRVEVYETRPSVIVNRPTPYYRPHYYQHTPAQVIVRPKHQKHHERNTTVVKPYSQRQDVNTTVVKDYRHSSQSGYSNGRKTVILSPSSPSSTTVITKHQNNYETHSVQPPSRTSVKQPKKIVIQSSGDAPPSTLAE